jgi:hypothetical protein
MASAPSLHEFIASLNEDEQASADRRHVDRPRHLSTPRNWTRRSPPPRPIAVPTEDYLMGEPRLADYLEAGMDALGISPEDEEDDLQRPV